MHCKVKDEHNCQLILKLLATIGLTVPSTPHVSRALAVGAKEEDLLGDTATTLDIEACRWDWVVPCVCFQIFIRIKITHVKI